MEAPYDAVTIERSKDGNKESSSWVPLLRQILICSAPWTAYFTTGLVFGSPTVAIPQIRNETNSTFIMTDDMASWLSSILGYAAVPWVFTFTYLISTFGRKPTYIILTLAIYTGLLTFYFCTTITQLLISEIILSNLQGSASTIGIIVISEYAAPKYRGVFLAFKSALNLWGIWVSNAIGTFCHWKTIGIFALVINVGMVNIFFWKESPAWLASKGKFDECRANHRWLRGTDDISEEELDKLIKSQQEYLSVKEDLEFKDYFTKAVATVKSKQFYKPICTSFILLSMHCFSGKFVCCMYVIDIIKKMTNNERTAYISMLFLDGATILCAYIGTALSKIITRRLLLFTTSSVAIIFLFILSIHLYLIKLSIVAENHYVSITLLTIFSMAISSGVIILASTLIGELVSLRYRSISMLITSLMYNIINSSLLKTAPMLFKFVGLEGGFLFYGVTSTVFTYICYKILPETKDKTLLEIEDYFKDNSKIEETERLMDNVVKNKVMA